MTSPLDNPIVYSIYCATNTVNGKKYIGQTSGKPARRWNQHLWGALNNSQLKCYAFWNAIRKYGRECFLFEVIEVVPTREEANNKEAYWIHRLNTMSPNGYNLVSRGEPRNETSAETKQRIRQSKLGVPRSAETKAKLRAANLGHKHSAETLRKMSESRKGEKNPNYQKPLSSEHREKLRQARKGRITRPETRIKLSEAHRGKGNGFYGKHHTSETRAKLRAQHLGMTASEEARKKMSRSRTGKKHTPESIEKIRASKKGELNYIYGKTHAPETKAKIRVAVIAAKMAANTSGCLGVKWEERTKSWRVRIRVNRKEIFLGRYKEYNTAVRIRKEAEIKYFGNVVSMICA